MKFRVARHTKELNQMIRFYTLIPGMEVLGSFKGHEGYDGVFIGIKGADWHLEFTVSGEDARHEPDEDDLLVFYAGTHEIYEAIQEQFRQNHINETKAKNPYWQENGTTYADPDGFRIVVAKPNA